MGLELAKIDSQLSQILKWKKYEIGLFRNKTTAFDGQPITFTITNQLQ